MALLLPAIAAAGFLLPSSSLAVCLCGSGDGAPTLVAPTNPAITLSMDGLMSDWDPVIADQDNVACDGPEGLDPDRDLAIPNGLDLVQFVHTWNGTSLFFYTRRTGNSNNVQRFAYYADLDNDGFLSATDKVIAVKWRGNTRVVEVYVAPYIPANAGSGDPMVDASGYGDGYDPPGTIGAMTLLRSGAWGSPDGLAMEFAVTWAELGIGAGAPHAFHTSSLTDFTLGPAGVADNVGGCGGGGTSTQYASATFAPSRAFSVLRAQTVVSPHLLTNTGNVDDTYDFTVSFTGAYAPNYALFRDVNRDGLLDAGDAPATHSSLLAASVLGANGGSFPLLVAYTLPPVGTGSVTATVTATSRFDVSVLRTVDDTLTIKSAVSLTVLKSAALVSDPVNGNFQPKSIPGALLNYTVQVTNFGDRGADDGSTSVADAVPTGTWLYLGDFAGPGDGPLIFDGSAVDPSGLTYSYIALDSDADGLDFYGPAGWGYHPNPVGGYDPAVTRFRAMLGGSFAASDGTTQPSFTIRFRVMVQ